MGHKKRNLLYLVSGLVPCVLLLAALAYVGAIPFGEASLLWRDAEIQYIDFAACLRSMLRGEGDFLYSFSKNLGGEMVSLISYYLASPFNLLFALASDAGLPTVFTLVMVLKLSACGVSFFHASTRLYGCKTVHLAFSTAYALMAYNVLYGWSIMWLDGVLVLPLLALGLYDLWAGRKAWLYAASLAYGLFTNFYIGYMLCIASVLFSLVHLLFHQGSGREKLALGGKFLAASCIGGFASAVMWVPAFLALLEGRAKFDGNASGILINFNPMGLAGKVVAGASSVVQVGSGTPHIFCGTLVLFLVLVFLLNREISGKVRLASLGVLCVFMVSFLFAPINVIWHGFSPNYAFNFRYAFLFNYVMIMLAQYALSRIASVPKGMLALVGAALAALTVALLAVRGVLALDFVSTAGCLTSLGAAAAVFAVLFFTQNRKGFVCTALVLVSVLEMGTNCGLSWDAYIRGEDAELLHKEAYQNFHQRVSPAVDYVKKLDDGFYRMEKTFWHDMNDPMFFSYNGLSHFSSSQQKHVLGLLEKMGLKNDRNICVYYRTGSTAGVDSLFGVKYVLSETDMEAVKGYEKLTDLDGIGIYENPSALPIAFLSQAEVLDVNMEQRDYFCLHNAIWSAVSGEAAPVLHPVTDYAVTLENLEYYTIANGDTRFVRADMEKPASICFEIPIDRELPLYFFFHANGAQDADVYINGISNGTYFHELRWDMTNVGTYSVGQTVQIRLELLTEQIALGDALFYYEDLQALGSHADAIRSDPVNLVQHSGSHLSGSFEAGEDQLLLLTVPYDTGWKLYIDGRRTEFIPVLDALMAVPVSAGSHTLEMRYIPRGGIMGCGLTAAALVAMAVWIALDKRRQANGKKE